MSEGKNTMKALRFHEYGGPEVLRFDEDVPVPTPGPGEVQIKVSGSGVNPIDWKLREGHLREWIPLELPAIVSREFSGIVSALGEGVTDLKVGDEVYGVTASGTCAEYAVAPVSTTALKPTTMDLADAASIPLAAMTAWQALFEHGGFQPNQRVLVHAAAGGVGTFASQFARLRGAYVYGTASPENFHLIAEAGVNEAIDYKATPFETVAKDVDIVIDMVGGETAIRSLQCLKPGGILVAVAGEPPTEEAERQGKRAVGMLMQPNRDLLREIAVLIQDVRVWPAVESVVRYDEAIEAQKESQTGHVRGKLVVRIS